MVPENPEKSWKVLKIPGLAEIGLVSVYSFHNRAAIERMPDKKSIRVIFDFLRSGQNKKPGHSFDSMPWSPKTYIQ